MRLTDRILATCSAAALAAMCTVALGSSEAQAARQQKHEARPVAARPVAARPAATRPVAANPRAAKAAASKRPVAAPRSGVSRTAATHHAGRPVKLRGVAAMGSKSGNLKAGKLRMAAASAGSWGGISCVPFARAATGMDVKGNAHAWWSSAAGVYERGQRPEAGSVLNFRSTARMRLGHVAVVARVIDSRTVEIDHANWAGPRGGKGRVARGVPVIDVSPANDWSAVQVGLAGGGFGSVYPTFGFIYDRPDRGVMVANTLAKPTTPRISEVAEAWSTRVIPTTRTVQFIDAPQRSLR